MPRQVTPEAAAAAQADLIRPGFLCEIAHLTLGTLRYSTRGELDFGSVTWYGGADVAPEGDGRWSLGLPNTDNTASALALSDALYDAAVRVWSYDNGHATLVYTGHVGEVASIGTVACEFALQPAADALAMLPATLIGPPLLNHAPSPGARYTWGGQDYILEPGR